MNKLSQISTCVGAFLLTLANVQAAPLDLSEEPLAVSLTVKSNLIIALDDSGSMSFETLAPANDGSYYYRDGNDSFVAGDGTFFFDSGFKSSYIFPYTEGPGTGGHRLIPPFPQFAWARSGAYNPSYYDPNVTYTPWRSFGTDARRQFTDIDPTAAESDPSEAHNNWDRTFNLTSDFEFTTGDDRFHVHNGMVLPAGIRMWRTDSTGGGSNQWRTTATDETWSGGNDARVGVDYAPAHYWEIVETGTYMVSPTALPGDCASPSAADYKVFEYAPSDFSSSDAQALGPDGRCLRRIDIASGTTEMQNFANWFSYTRKRHAALKAGTIQALQDLDRGLRVGMFTINNRNPVTMRNFDNTPGVDERNLLLEQIAAETSSGGTPNRNAMGYLGEQFETNSNVVQYACQQNFGMLFTDGFAQTSGPTVTVQDSSTQNLTLGSQTFEMSGVAPYSDGFNNTIADIAMNYYADLNVTGFGGAANEGLVPIPSGCYDGSAPAWADCNNNLHMNTYGITLNGRGTIFGVTHDTVLDAYDTMLPLTWPDTNGSRDPTQIDDLYHASVNGRGRMLNARNPQELASAFQEALASILAAGAPISALTASSTRLETDSFLFRANFDVDDWTGDLLAFDAERNQVGDSAATQLLARDPATRNLFTSTPGTTIGGDGADFVYADLDAAQQTALTTEVTNEFTAAEITALGGASEAARKITRYVQGFNDAPSIFRARSVPLGDIVNSKPTLLSSFDEGWTRFDADYKTYVNTDKQAAGRKVIFVGANDGMLHAFSINPSNLLTELFAYVPRGVMSKLPQLASPGYSHTFYVDATPQIADVRIGGSWKTILVGTAGKGARTIFALDVTNPTTFSASDVLWEVVADEATSGTDERHKLGFVTGQPIITRLQDGTWAVIVGNGYNSTNNGGSLLVLNAATGAIIDTIDTGAGTAATPGGLAEGRRQMNAVDGLWAENVFAGDILGNMWKFNISSSSTGGGTVELGGNPLFIARDASGDVQPITSAPTIARTPDSDVFVYFGTGKLLENNDNVLDVNQRTDTFYAVIDEQSGTPSGNKTRSDLGEISLSASASCSTTDDGWYLDLLEDGAGEQVLSQPQIAFGRLLFTSYLPNEGACTPGGQSFLYQLSPFGGPSCGGLGTGGNNSLAAVLEISDGRGDGDSENITGTTPGSSGEGDPRTQIEDAAAPVDPPVVLEQQLQICRLGDDCSACDEDGDGDCDADDRRCTADASIPNKCDACDQDGDGDCDLEDRLCPTGERAAQVISPTTLDPIFVSCITEGRVRWGRDSTE